MLHTPVIPIRQLKPDDFHKNGRCNSTLIPWQNVSLEKIERMACAHFYNPLAFSCSPSHNHSQLVYPHYVHDGHHISLAIVSVEIPHIYI